MGENLQWYATATGGTALTGTAAVTTGTLYVSQIVNGCESERAGVAVTVNEIPALPVVTLSAFCQSATVADLASAGENLRWYAVATGGEALESTIALSSGLYYVSHAVNSCESARVAVIVTITVTDTPAGAAMQDYTAGETLANLDPSGQNIVWYEDAALATVLPVTTPLTDGRTYYAVQVNDSCESLPLAVTVNEVLSTDTFNRDTLKVYPNPVKDILNIRYSQVVTSVVIYNSLGQKVIEKAVNGTDVQLNMASLSEGVYTVNVVSGTKTASVRVIR
jgi:hypothetical protein